MLSKFIIGSANFGTNYGITNKNQKKISKKDIKKILELAIKYKCNTIDTAGAYHLSENIIGNIEISKKFHIITKFKHINLKKNIEIQIRQSLNKSLINLKRNKIFGLLIHDSKYLRSKKSSIIFKTLKKLKEENKVKYIGVSLLNFNDLKFISEHNFDIIQLPLNIFDQRILDKNIYEIIKKKNISIHARSIFLQGCLLEKTIPQKLKKYNKYFINFENFLSENNFTREIACLDFILKQNKLIKKYIFGVNSLDEIKKIIETLKALKTSKKFKKIDYSKLLSNNKYLIDPFRW